MYPSVLVLTVLSVTVIVDMTAHAYLSNYVDECIGDRIQSFHWARPDVTRRMNDSLRQLGFVSRAS